MFCKYGGLMFPVSARAKSPALPLPALRLHHCAWQQHTLGSMLKLNLARLPRISIAPPLLAYTTPQALPYQ
jgi:hypothetical protein